jgi:hypothetical protein
VFSKSENGGSKFLLGGLNPENKNSIHWLYSKYWILEGLMIYTNDIGFNNETLLDKYREDVMYPTAIDT